jgi:predicted ArsR family transcriptional regulator
MKSTEENSWGGPTNDAIVEAVRDAYQDDRTDLLEGGVPCRVLADELGMEMAGMRDRLVELVEEGRLVKVRGATPDNYRPRVSYLPADALDQDSATLS